MSSSKSKSNININSNKTTFQRKKNPLTQPAKMFSPIGALNSKIISFKNPDLETEIDKIVKTFIEFYKEKIVRAIITEVENKINQRLKPLQKEIKSIEDDFNSIYYGELDGLKGLSVLAQFKSNITNLDHDISQLKNNVDKYESDIKTFNVYSERSNLLATLHKELDNLLKEIKKNENKENTFMEVDEECFTYVVNEHNELNNEVNEALNELSDLINILTGKVLENNDGKNSNYNKEENLNNKIIQENLNAAINCFYEKFISSPINQENINNSKFTINSNSCLNNTTNKVINNYNQIDEEEKNRGYNYFINLPDFFN